MKNLLVAAVFSIFALGLVSPTLAAVTFHFDSEGLGDIIARGETGTLTDADGDWTVTGVGPFEGIRFGFDHNDPSEEPWGIRLYNANSTELVPGTYTSFGGPNSETQPYMYVSHLQSCEGDDEPGNTFTVTEVEFDLYGRPIRFSGSFIIRCSPGAQALTGSLDFTFDGNLGAPNFTYGNILVTLDSIIYEYTTAGALVQVVPIRRGENPSPLWGLDRSGDEGALDLDMGRDGILRLFNEQSQLVQFTFSDGLSRLSSLDPSGQWVHSTFDDEWNESIGTQCGLVTMGPYVFAVDGPVGGDARGIVRFNTDTGYSAERFEGAVWYRDLAEGPDGKLYALDVVGSTVQVFDPVSLNFERTVNLATGVDAIALSPAGTIYGVDGPEIFSFDPTTGAQLDSLDTGFQDMIDIDISRTGVIAAGVSRWGFDAAGQFVISDVSLSSATRIEIDPVAEWQVTYVGFADSLFTDGFESGDTLAWSGSVP